MQGVEDLIDDEIMESCILSYELNECETTTILNPSSSCHMQRDWDLAKRSQWIYRCKSQWIILKATELNFDDGNAKHREQAELLAGGPPIDTRPFLVENMCET